MREVSALETTQEAMLLARSTQLAQRLGLVAELERWRHAVPLAGAILVAIIVVIAYGLTVGLVGDNRSISAMEAFIATLGINLLALAIWFLSLLWPWGTPGPALFSIGHALLGLVRRLGSGANPHAATLARATLETLGRARLLPWLFGLSSHAIWAAAYALVSAGVYYLFYVRQYWLVWETTIQGKEAFAAFVTITGWLPGQLGFPTPDTGALPEQSGLLPDQQLWAWWIIGCVFVYGFLLRLVLAGLCWAVWRVRQRSFRVDTSDPYHRKVLARIDALQSSQIVDPERAHAPNERAAVPLNPAHDKSVRALIGFELPAEMAWPPAPFAQAVALSSINENIAGTARERSKVLTALAQALPAKALLVCRAPSSPDRGTARFLTDVCLYAQDVALLLVDAEGRAGAADHQRWSAWLAGIDKCKSGVFIDADAALAWLGVEHD